MLLRRLCCVVVAVLLLLCRLLAPPRDVSVFVLVFLGVRGGATPLPTPPHLLLGIRCIAFAGYVKLYREIRS